MTINNGERVDIKCSANANPKPRIEWFKLGKSSEKQILSNLN